jgi:hypothetical protein
MEVIVAPVTLLVIACLVALALTPEAYTLESFVYPVDYGTSTTEDSGAITSVTRFHLLTSRFTHSSNPPKRAAHFTNKCLGYSVTCSDTLYLLSIIVV